jgi:hypothetical protein
MKSKSWGNKKEVPYKSSISNVIASNETVNNKIKATTL